MGTPNTMVGIAGIAANQYAAPLVVLDKRIPRATDTLQQQQSRSR